MKLSEFEEHLITEEMPVGSSGKTLGLTWDANLFTGEVGRRMARTYRECAARVQEQEQKPAPRRGKKAAEGEPRSLVKIADDLAASMELNAALTDIDRTIYADVLACDRYGILKDWDMEDGEGRHVLPTYEVLVRQRGDVLKAIFQFSREQSLPKKQEAGTPQSQETSLTTSSPTSDGSSPRTIPAPESQTTSSATT